MAETEQPPAAAPQQLHPAPQLSSLQALLNETPTTTTQSPHPPHLQNLALQTLHNLQHQHQWTDLRIHHYCTSNTSSSAQRKLLPRPLLSGLPPQRLYIHPDEQIALLQAQKEIGGSGLGEVKSEREWVCPSQLRERWSLRRFGEVFDGIGVEVPGFDDGEEEEDGADGNKWRTTKRVLLATVDDDSTVVYYIVHDGIVKPRQN